MLDIFLYLLHRDIPEAYKECEPLIEAVDQIKNDINELKQQHRETKKVLNQKQKELEKAEKTLEKIEAAEAKCTKLIDEAEEVKYYGNLLGHKK